jgi:hypothetical protein
MAHHSRIRGGRSFHLAALALLLTVGQPATASERGALLKPHTPDPTCTHCTTDLGRPFFDIRIDVDSLPLDRVTKASTARLIGDIAAARNADIARLTRFVPDVTVDQDPFLGTPSSIRSTSRNLTAAAKAESASDLISTFITEYPALLEISSDELKAARVERDFFTDHNGIHHLTWQQQIRSVDLYGCELRANIAANGEIINVGSTMLPRPASDFDVMAPAITDADALIIAARDAGVELSQTPVPAADAEGPTLKRTWEPHPDLRSDEHIATSLVYFPLDRDTIHPAWAVVVPVKGVGHCYDTLVDAIDGRVLFRQNRLLWDSTQPITMRVYTSDSPAPMSPATPIPSTLQAPFIASTLVTINPADVIPFSPNGWINDGNMETVGNNVDAHVDRDGNNVADLPRPNGGAGRLFDFTYDTNLAPNANSTQANASIVQLFYLANRFHDRLYALGFNEAAKNFQTVNFTGLGVGNDAVQADCQDGYPNVSSSVDNANFSTTGTDGSGGRMQMYVFTGSTPDRDGSLDADIVYHELGHGVSIRLHNGLSGNQPQGMGEGWSDFFGISLLAEATDDPDATFSTGGYATYQLGGILGFTSNYYYGIRRFPYSVNMTKNPLTFADLDPAQYSIQAGVPISPLTGVLLSSSANEVHNAGEVWCMMLMECRAAMIRKYGFAGNQRMLQMVVDGMKLSARNPTFVQARDAILQASTNTFGGVDNPDLWDAFAKRGIGSGAIAPVSTSASGVRESFTVPQTANFDFPSGLPQLLQPNITATFPVNITGTLLTLNSGTGTMYLSINGGAYAEIPLQEGTPNQYTATIPALPCNTRVSYYFTTGTSIGTKSNPTGAPAATYRAVVTTGSTPVLNEPFDAPGFWISGPHTATSGRWAWGDPVGTAAQTENAHSGTTCWVTGLGVVGGTIGDADVDSGLTTLTSPAFDLSAYPDAIISYWRWYSNGASTGPYADTFRVDVSVDNGTTWFNAETIGPGSASDPNVNPGWRFASWRLSQLSLVPSATVRIRFVAEDAGAASVVEAAIDDFAIEGAVCADPTVTCCRGTTCMTNVASGSCVSQGDITAMAIGGACAPSTLAGCCYADFNKDGNPSIDDVFIYLNAWFTATPFAKVGGDGVQTPVIDDLFLFINLWFGGCT